MKVEIVVDLLSSQQQINNTGPLIANRHMIEWNHWSKTILLTIF